MSRSEPGVTGRCFQIETMGAVDGPGLRLVLFLQGCPLRCPYCHNPESWAVAGGRTLTVDEVMAMLHRYRGYYRDGGLTLSGGEPLMQPEFVLALLRRCRAEGFHTAIDTAGAGVGPGAMACVDEADLLLIDIKFPEPEQHLRELKVPLSAPLGLLDRRETAAMPVWVRHVVVPGLTESPASIDALAALIRPYSCVKKVELLPFRKLCLEKYRQMGLRFPLEDTPEPTPGQMAALAERLGKQLPGMAIG